MSYAPSFQRFELHSFEQNSWHQKKHRIDDLAKKEMR